MVEIDLKIRIRNYMVLKHETLLLKYMGPGLTVKHFL